MQIWNNSFFAKSLRDRASTNPMWCTPDGEAEYIKNIKKAVGSKNTTYSTTDIEYRFNSYGFRSDEFDPTTCEILYSGCSFTEGTGLPLSHVWCKMLNAELSNSIGREIPFTSVARGGISADGITRNLYFAIEELKLRPKCVIVLFPHIFRTEFFLDHLPPADSDIFSFIPNVSTDHLSFADQKTVKNISENIRISNSVNSLVKNIILLTLLCEKYGIRLLCGTWTGSMPRDEFNIKAGDTCGLNFDGANLNIDPYKVIQKLCPPKIYESNFISSARFRAEVDIPKAAKKFDINIGRDFLHPGPNSHQDFTEQLLNSHKEEIIKLL